MEKKYSVCVDENGMLSLPTEIISEMKLNPGDELVCSISGDNVYIEKPVAEAKRTVAYYLSKGFDILAAEYFASGRKKLTRVEAISDSTLLLIYDEDEERIYDCRHLLREGGVFEPLRDSSVFRRVFLEHGAVCWDIDPAVNSDEYIENRIDLCPDACYISSVPACLKNLTREEMMEAREAALEVGIKLEDEMEIAGFALSRRELRWRGVT